METNKIKEKVLSGELRLQDLKEKVLRGKLIEAIRSLKKGISYKNKLYQNEIVQIHYRLNSLEKNHINAVVTTSRYIEEQKEITKSVLNFIKKLDVKEFEDKYFITEKISKRLKKISNFFIYISVFTSIIALFYSLFHDKIFF